MVFNVLVHVKIYQYANCFLVGIIISYFSFPQTPLIILHVALTNELISKVSQILHSSESDTATVADTEDEPSTAMFYSLSSTQHGLRGFNFGFHMIMKALPEIKREFPHIERFATLSPIPGFREWVVNAINISTETCVTKEVEALSKVFEIGDIFKTKQHLLSLLNDKSCLFSIA